MPPLSLYIHIPWCVRKCPYCDFNSHTLKADNEQVSREEKYISALIIDFQQSLSNIQDRPLHSIFIGGGTPSLFKPESYERLFKAIFQEVACEKDIEITLEANPGTADEKNFRGYRESGINRISLGVQSFNPEKLHKLGRIHSADQAKNAFYLARNAGFERINLDLMFGLPDQTVEEALNDLEQALILNPDHLSWYQLTLEPNTVFYKRPPILPNEDYLWEIELEGKKIIQSYYEQYEISAYSQVNQQCRHNVNYWQFGDYLGIGAGAHGKTTNVQQEKTYITRTQKKRQPEDYIQGLQRKKSFTAKTEEIPVHDRVFEFMLNALRLYQPISYDLFSHRTGIAIEKIRPQLINAQDKNLIILNEDTFDVTNLGHRYLNDLQALFL